MNYLGLENRIRKFSNSQQLYRTQNYKTLNSYQIDLKRYNTATIAFQSGQNSNVNFHRSLSSKHKLFKSAKKIETNEKMRSNSFKNISLKTQNSGNMNKKLSLNQSKQFPISTKSNRHCDSNSIINDKKEIVEDIIGRLRNKNSIRIDIKRELIINDLKNSKNINNDNEQDKEPQLKLKEMIKDQVERRIQQQAQQSIQKDHQQMIKMREIIEQKSTHLTKLQNELGNKMNWIQDKMSEFVKRQNNVKQRQESIHKKEKQIQESLLKKIQEQHKAYQLLLNKQFNDKISQFNQNSQIKTRTIVNNDSDNNHFNNNQTLPTYNSNSAIKQQVNSLTTNQQQKTTVNRRKVSQRDNNTKVQKKQKSNEMEIVNFNSIEQITIVEKSESMAQVNINQKQNTSKSNIKSQNAQRGQSFIQSNIINKKSLQKNQSQQKQHQQSQQSQLEQKILNSSSKPNEKQKDRKLKVTTLLKNMNRSSKLLYFIGQISHYSNLNMKKNKKYEFKMANLYLLKYVYDRFRCIQNIYQQLMKKKEITQENYNLRVEQNKSMKQNYKKWKAYVNKTLQFSNKQIEAFLDEESPKFSYEDKRFFTKYLFAQIRKTVQFYEYDTGGKWTEHKVNLCYFMMMVAVFIILQMEFNKIVIDPEGKEHPNYMIDEIDKFTEDELKQKMSEAYQLFRDLYYNELT